MVIKILVITVLALGLLIPLGIIDGKINERERFRETARQSIASSWTGRQEIYTPVLIQPYILRENTGILEANPTTRNALAENRAEKEKTHNLIILPDSVNVKAEVNTEKRKRGIYSIPVYTSKIQMAGLFSKENIAKNLDRLENKEDFVRLDTPWMTVIVTDPRGFMGEPKIRVNDQQYAFAPGSGLDNRAGLHAVLNIKREKLVFNTEISLRGMQSLKFIPIGLNTQVKMRSPWPHPEFYGAFLPLSHEISEKGFLADWHTNPFSTDILQKTRECQRGNCDRLSKMGFGVNFIESVDIYLQSERAIKYAILFIGLSFVTFFIFETLKNLRIHPIQYTLVGLGIAVFYLLLVSLSEHIAFSASYFIAACSCVALLAYYIRYVLGSQQNAIIFAGLYGLLYATLYFIIQSEDFALLLGSLLLFIALASIMIVTRNINWYELNFVSELAKFRKQKTSMEKSLT